MKQMCATNLQENYAYLIFRTFCQPVDSVTMEMCDAVHCLMMS